MTAEVSKLPPRDPIFALAPELWLHQSKLDGQLVVNSREVARVFLRDDQGSVIRHIMWSISCDRSVWPQWHDEFRQRPDGTVDITSRGLLSALSHWGFEYQQSKRHCEFMGDWADLITNIGHEIEAKTGVNPILEGFKKFFPGLRMLKHDAYGELRECCQDCSEPVLAGPVLHDELWATVAPPDTDGFLCFACFEKRLGRPLTQADLQRCPFNAGWVEFDGADVAALQFARGRRLLPEAKP